MSTKPNIVGIDWMADFLGRKAATIRVDVTRKPESLPPRLIIPGCAKIMWVEEDALAWLNALRPKAKAKPGRPSQVSQASPQCQ